MGYMDLKNKIVSYYTSVLIIHIADYSLHTLQITETLKWDKEIIYVIYKFTQIHL
jgi:hypothetical protein